MNSTATSSDVIDIPLSKIKIIALLVGALLFVAGGIWLVKNSGTFHTSPLLITILGYLAIVFFGVCALFIVNKLFDSRPGFMIDNDGMTDNSSTFSVGFIPWADVKGISVNEVGNQKFINVKVEDAEGYINRQTNALGKRATSMNYKMYGSPVNISAGSLRISFDELYAAINQRWQQSPNY
jgi:hypothetical protein